MPSLATPKYVTRLTRPSTAIEVKKTNATAVSTNTTSTLANKGKFYPENLYRVISEFQNKHQKHNNNLELLNLDRTFSDQTDIDAHDLKYQNTSLYDLTLSDVSTFSGNVDHNWWNYSNTNNTFSSKTTTKTTCLNNRDPFPRIPAQLIRCQTCCNRLCNQKAMTLQSELQPTSPGGSSTATSSSSSSCKSETKPILAFNESPRYMRRSYTLSHFDDTYNSNELKRAKIIPIVRYSPDKPKPRWRL